MLVAMATSGYAPACSHLQEETFRWKLQVKRGWRIRGDERVAKGVTGCGGERERERGIVSE
jgi:hypothetical protein